MLIMEKAMHVWEQGIYGNPYLPLNIVINLKLLLKNCLNKRNSNLGPYSLQIPENVVTIIKSLLNHLSCNTELQLPERVSIVHVVRKIFSPTSASKQGSSDLHNGPPMATICYWQRAFLVHLPTHSMLFFLAY